MTTNRRNLNILKNIQGGENITTEIKDGKVIINGTGGGVITPEQIIANLEAGENVEIAINEETGKVKVSATSGGGSKKYLHCITLYYAYNATPSMSDPLTINFNVISEKATQLTYNEIVDYVKLHTSQWNDTSLLHSLQATGGCKDGGRGQRQTIYGVCWEKDGNNDVLTALTINITANNLGRAPFRKESTIFDEIIEL